MYVYMYPSQTNCHFGLKKTTATSRVAQKIQQKQDIVGLILVRWDDPSDKTAKFRHIPKNIALDKSQS